MANTVNIQTIQDGPKNVVIKVYLASDGATGEIADQVVVDYSALSGTFGDLKLSKLQWDLTGFAVTLEWDATADVPIWNISPGANELCFEEFGGIPNDSGAGKTGDIVLSTTGFDTAGDNGSIIIWARK